MLNLINLSISLFFISLTGWTLTIYFFKKDSQKSIREELTNLFDICKTFFLSLKNLIGILGSRTLATEEREVTPVEKSLLKKK